MNKKGSSIISMLTAVVVVFSFILLLFVLNKNVLEPFNDQIQVDDSFTETAKEISQENIDDHGTIWDIVVVFIFIGIWAYSLIAAYNLDSQPMFFVVAVLAMIAILIIAMGLSNAYEDLIATGEYLAATQTFRMTHWLANNIVMLIIIQGFSIAGVLYAKN